MKRELTPDEVIQRGLIAQDTLNNQGIQLLFNEIVGQAIHDWMETPTAHSKQREDHYHTVRVLNETVETLKTWVAHGLAEQAARIKQDKED